MSKVAYLSSATLGHASSEIPSITVDGADENGVREGQRVENSGFRWERPCRLGGSRKAGAGRSVSTRRAGTGSVADEELGCRAVGWKRSRGSPSRAEEAD